MAGRGGGRGQMLAAAAVTPESLPGLIAKMRSTAAPEVAAGTKGLWGLACAVRYSPVP